MKVTIQTIAPASEEHADLYVYKCDEATNRLCEYITSNSYQEVAIPCAADGQIHKIPSRNIYWIECVQEKLLLPPQFVRISRSIIINTAKAASYRPQFNGLMQVNLMNGDTAYISRKYLKEVRERILEVRHEER